MKAQAIVAVVVASVLLVAATSPGGEAGAPSGPRTAPDFTLPSLAQISLEDFLASKAVVLWFTNLCGGCQAGMARLDELRETFGDSVEVVAISVLGEDEKTVRDAIAKLDVGFPFLIDADGMVTKLYSGGYVPNSCPVNNIFFIDRKGTIVETSHYPGLPQDDLEEHVRKLLR
jgi:peroxiredoxin